MPTLYLQALLDELTTTPKRKRPDRQLVALAAKAQSPELRQLLEAFANHDASALRIGEYAATGIASNVPAPDDGDERDDVLVIGTSPGGDLYVVPLPGTAADARAAGRVARIIHDADWTEVPLCDGLDAMVESFVAEARRAKQQTPLDGRLGKRKPKERWLDDDTAAAPGGPIAEPVPGKVAKAALVSRVTPPVKLVPSKRARPRPVRLAKAVKALFVGDDDFVPETLTAGIAIGATKHGELYRPVVVDARTKPRLVTLAPRLEVPTFAHGIAPDGSRCVVAPGAVAYVVDPATGKTRKLPAREGMIGHVGFLGNLVAVTHYLMGDWKLYFHAETKSVGTFKLPATDDLTIVSGTSLLLARNSNYGGSLLFDAPAGKPRHVATFEEAITDAYEVDGTLVFELEDTRRVELAR